MIRKHAGIALAAAAALCLFVVLQAYAEVDVMTVTGKAVKVDTEQRQLSLKTDSGESMQFAVEETTNVVRGGQRAELSDIKAGDTLTVSYKKTAVNLIALAIGIEESKT